MAGGKLPPRQKMIGMMYLVLTALLAMNVSKDILDAFILVNTGLEKTVSNFLEKNNSDYNSFEKSFNENKQKVEPFWNKAQDVRKSANDLVDYIDQIKANLIFQTDKLPSLDKVRGKDANGKDTILGLKHVSSKDNYDIPTNILIGAEPNKPKSGELTAAELKQKMSDFSNKLMGYVPAESIIAQSLKEVFDFSSKKDASGTENNWESMNFYHIPLAAVVTILSKMQTDVRNAESDVVKHLMSSIDASSFKFNKLAPAVIANSNYILVGDSFKADVFLAAFDTTQSPVIYYSKDDGDVDLTDPTNPVMKGAYDSLPNSPDGKGLIRAKGNSEGEQVYKGIINIKAPGGKVMKFPWKTTFQVARPTTTIAATKMNVFYIGVDNPVSVSAPGVPADKVRPSISNGSISKSGKDGYVVRVSTPGTARVTVSAEVDGANKKMGDMEFRVKRIPNPVPYVGGKTGSETITLAQLKASATIQAKMENFDFDISVTVQSYIFSTSIQGAIVEEKIPGNKLTGKALQYINTAKKNQKFYFEKIQVRMPDGTVRELSPVSLKVI
jgi:gliding motility-associated protein GldM